MTVRANKPAFSIREKLKELDYSHVPYDKMPAGSVIQVVKKDYDPGWVSTSSTSYVTSNISLSITPKKINSLILLDYRIPMSHTPNTGTALVSIIYKNGTILNNVTNYQQGYIRADDMYTSFTIQESDFPNSLETQTYEIYFKNGDSTSGTVHLVHNGSRVYLRLWEIAQ